MRARCWNCCTQQRVVAPFRRQRARPRGAFRMPQPLGSGSAEACVCCACRVDMPWWEATTTLRSTLTSERTATARWRCGGGSVWGLHGRAGVLPQGRPLATPGPVSAGGGGLECGSGAAGRRRRRPGSRGVWGWRRRRWRLAMRRAVVPSKRTASGLRARAKPPGARAEQMSRQTCMHLSSGARGIVAPCQRPASLPSAERMCLQWRPR